MKMILKNKSIKKIKIKFTKKNLFIFLIIFSVISLLIGSAFFLYLNNSDKNMIINNINNYFKINENYIFLDTLKENLFLNTKSLFIIWILGISVIGIILILFILFFELFSIGFTICSIIYNYGIKGIIVSLLYIFPSKLFSLLLLLFISFFSLSFSYQLILNLIKKEENNNINVCFTKYLKILLIFLLLFIASSILEAFIYPFIIKIFTFFIK